jgi:hypothetical protein
MRRLLRQRCWRKLERKLLGGLRSSTCHRHWCESDSGQLTRPSSNSFIPPVGLWPCHDSSPSPQTPWYGMVRYLIHTCHLPPRARTTTL